MKFNGLTDQEAEESRRKYGSNEIPDSEPTTFWAEFKQYFNHRVIKGFLELFPESRRFRIRDLV